MPGGNGPAMLRRMRRDGSRARFLVVTADPTDEVRAEAVAAGAMACLAKPVEARILLDFLRSRTTGPAAQEQLSELREWADLHDDDVDAELMDRLHEMYLDALPGRLRPSPPAPAPATRRPSSPPPTPWPAPAASSVTPTSPRSARPSPPTPAAGSWPTPGSSNCRNSPGSDARSTHHRRTRDGGPDHVPAPPERRGPRDRPRRAPAVRTALVVDDSAAARHRAATLLRLGGWHVVEAVGTDAALQHGRDRRASTSW